jgi:gamma-glutamyl:cysteine ligase YbdK (ATP-grasp superfamily)
MGHEVSETHFKNEEFRHFQQALREETSLLEEWISDRHLSDASYVAGIELEMCLVDDSGNPSACNQSLLDALHSPIIVPELSKFNIEFNVDPISPRGDGLQTLTNRLVDTWTVCSESARALGLSVVSIGILPTLRDEHLVLGNMSELHRYHALNEQVLRLRRGKPVRLDISGVETLISEHLDVMLEAGATSLQLHLQVPQAQAANAYNLATIVSAPMVAIGANSPLLFGKRLWQETRIPLFEQSVAVEEPVNRVNFGTGYASHDLLSLFLENESLYPVLLPIKCGYRMDKLEHLRLHNGTIWRWNRPIIGFDPNGRPHLRIEHRVMAAGTTAIDMAAQMAFYYGMMIHLLNTPGLDVRGKLPFITAWNNFYESARLGLKAQVTWLDGKKWPLDKLIIQELIPVARRGLEFLNVDAPNIDRWLQIIESRAETGQTGAQWQSEFFHRSGDVALLVKEYRARQQSGEPVHEWSY